MLDRLYNVLDNLALRHQLFKVETIGCTHMVVGNLQPSLRDHVAKACWFAMNAHKAAQTIVVCPDDPSLGYVLDVTAVWMIYLSDMLCIIVVDA